MDLNTIQATSTFKLYNLLDELVQPAGRSRSPYSALFTMHCFFPGLLSVKSYSFEQWGQARLTTRHETEPHATENYLEETIKYKHTIEPLNINNIEAYEVIAKSNTEHYEIHCCGNLQDAKDAMELKLFREYHLPEDKRKNYIFWNYPGVGLSKQLDHPSPDLFAEYGFDFLQYLVQQKNIKPENITVYGFSIGGAIAAKIARIAYQKQIPVKLKIERSFSTMAEEMICQIKNLQIYGQSAYMISAATTAFGLTGALLGMSLADLSYNTSLILLSPIAFTGFVLSKLFEATGYLIGNIFIKGLAGNIANVFKQDSKALLAIYGESVKATLKLAGEYLQEGFATVALYLVETATLLTNIASGLIGTAAIVAGSVLGAVAGSISLIQLPFTDKPFILPFEKIIKFFLTEAQMTLDSKMELETIQAISAQNNLDYDITTINTLDDPVVLKEASLNKGLEIEAASFMIPPGNVLNANEERIKSISRVNGIKSIWYQQGKHDKPLQNPVRVTHLPNTNKPTNNNKR